MSPAPSAIELRCRVARSPSRRRHGCAARAAPADRHGCRPAPPPPRPSRARSPSIDRRQRADRRLAAAAQRLDQRPLGRERVAGRGVVDRAPPRRARARRARADLDRDDPLAGRRHARLGRRSTSEMRDAKPSRVSPAAASTSASCAPSSSLRNRVSRLPRMPVNRAPGNSRVSCAIRRTLPVPIDGRVAESGDESLDRRQAVAESSDAARSVQP